MATISPGLVQQLNHFNSSKFERLRFKPLIFQLP